MKASKAQIDRALRSPTAEVRLFLLHGPDEAGSRALAQVLATSLGAAAERVEFSARELKEDPARLADEAASISMFATGRSILVDPASDEIVPAVEALLTIAQAGNPVVLVAGALRPTSRLLKLALAAPAAMVFASYVPEGREADKLVLELARVHGLSARSEVVRRIADASAGNRALIEQELVKYALFLDAAHDRPRTLDHDVIDAIGAASEEGDLSRLVDSVGGGDATSLQVELVRLASEGIEGVPLVRAVLRRMLLLSRLRAEVDRGNSVDSVMASQGKSLFWKEKPIVAQQLARWRSQPLAKSVGRLLDAERQLKASGGLGAAAVDEELFAICRQAARAV